jgi:hypothetical protein
MVPGSAWNWIAVNAVQQSSLKKEIKAKNMTTLQLIRSLSRSPARFAFLLIPLALAIFTSSVDAGTISQEINFHEMVPCVGELVDLEGPFRVSFTVEREKVTETKAFVGGIRGFGQNTGRTYSVDPDVIIDPPGFYFERIYVYKNGGKGPKIYTGSVGHGQLIIKFLVVGRAEGQANIRFWATQAAEFTLKRGTLNAVFQPLKVCVMPVIGPSRLSKSVNSRSPD